MLRLSALLQVVSAIPADTIPIDGEELCCISAHSCDRTSRVKTLSAVSLAAMAFSRLWARSPKAVSDTVNRNSLIVEMDENTRGTRQIPSMAA